MNICQKCKNEQVNKFYIVGQTAEDGQKFCDKCVGIKDGILSKVFKKLKGDKE